MTLAALRAAAAAVTATLLQLARRAVCHHPAPSSELLLLGEGFRRRRCERCGATWVDHQ